MRSLDDLLARPELIGEIAARAKTRAKWLGHRGLVTLSVIELWAMALMLDVYLEDHPLATPGASARQDSAGPKDDAL